MKLDWNRKTAWLGLMTLLLALEVTWIALGKVPAEIADARAGSSPRPSAG